MAYSTPKTDWSSADGVSYTDMNRIENNTLQNHTDIGTNKTTTDAHAADTTIHFLSLTSRQASTEEFRVECRTSDPSTPSNGRMWLRTDL